MKYDELGDINHADLLIFPAKIVFSLIMENESTIPDTCKLQIQAFAGMATFLKFVQI